MKGGGGLPLAGRRAERERERKEERGGGGGGGGCGRVTANEATYGFSGFKGYVSHCVILVAMFCVVINNGACARGVISGR